MKLTPPFSTSIITQNFGDNAVTLYSGMGLKGHPGIDFQAPWGAPIPAATDAFCYSVIKNADPAFYQCVYTIVDDVDGNSYEVSYGHCSTIPAEINTDYKLGDRLAYVGNSGSVFAGGVEVTEAEKIAGSHVGAHLHFQVRLLRKLKIADLPAGAHTINNGSGRYETPEGYCYIVPFWDNGYNGCVNPTQFFDSMSDTMRSEIQVLNHTTDPSVQQGFISLIVQQARQFLGF